MFEKTCSLSFLLFRQQRLKILIWLTALLVVTLAVASTYPDIYPDEQARHAFAMTVQNPAMLALVGVGYNVEDYMSIGALFAHEMLLFTAIAVAIMNILLVGRTTRGDEEDGRLELVRSLPVGRLSYLSATVIVILATNIVLALLVGSGLALLRIEGMDMNSSLLYGAILGATGLCFGAFTAVFAQLSDTSRGTTMLSFGAMIVFFLLRAIGDVSSETLALVSPLGWTVRSEVYVHDYWWPVFLLMALAVVVTILAFYLNGIRDVEAGFLPSKPGCKYASTFLQTSIGLIVRLQRTNILSWTIGIFLLSAAFGSILGDMETYLSDLEIMEMFLDGDASGALVDQYIGLVIAIMSLIATVPVAMTVLHLKGEESKDRIENIYSRAVSRTKFLMNYFLVAIVVSMIMQFAIAIGLWAISSSLMDEELTLGTIMSAALAFLPAIWVIIGLVVFLIGLLPKLASLVWMYFSFCFIVLYLGGMLEFPEWLIRLSVFEHVSFTLVEDWAYVNAVVLTAIALCLVGLGLFGYTKRDIK